MIKIKIQFHRDEIVYFKVSGHANGGKYGEDIICAGVSSVVQMTLNGLIEILQINTLNYEMAEGLIICDLREKTLDSMRKEIGILTKSMFSFLKEMANSYPKNIKMIIEEV